MIIASRTQFHVERPWGQYNFTDGSICGTSLNTAVLLWVVIQYPDQYLQNSEPKTQPQRAGSSTPYANLLFLFSVYVRAKLLTVSLELRTENYE